MADIDKNDMAFQCVSAATSPPGTNAHYLAAAAMMRSKLKDDAVNGQFGPYMWTQAEWDANPDRTNPALGAPFGSNDVKDWMAQVSVFALNTARDFASLQGTLGHNPSALELFQKQWPGGTDATVATSLQQACNDTRQAILDALAQQMPPDPAAVAANVIADPKKPIATPPGGGPMGGGGPVGGGGPAGGGDGGGAAPPKPTPADDPAPFAAFDPSVLTTFWPVVSSAPGTRLVSYVTAAGQTVGRPGRCFFANRNGAKRHHVGIDLFGAEGDVVVACANGKIVNFYKFLNSKGRDTFALVIAHEGVVVNYGEVAPDSLTATNLKLGDTVSAGQMIGRIGATAMLHFETYVPGTQQNVRWMVGDPRPFAVRNPTALLLRLAAVGQSAGGVAPVAPAAAAASPASGLSDALKAALRLALRLHEIGDASPYRLFFAGKGVSGASFGFMQGDLAAGQPEVTNTFRDALAAAQFPASQIDDFLRRLSVHLIANPLDPVDTAAINAALLASRARVDAMDEQILTGVYQQLQRCIATAAGASRTIAAKALIYMALWINMSGPPTSLLRFLAGHDPGMSHPVPPAGAVVDGVAMEAYLHATAYFSENPGNFAHISTCAAAGAATLAGA